MDSTKEDIRIQTRDLEVRRGNRQIFNDASLELKSGKIYAIAGPNGAGKTTLLDAITGLLAPARGDIKLLGQTPPLKRGVTSGGVPIVLSTNLFG